MAPDSTQILLLFNTTQFTCLRKRRHVGSMVGRSTKQSETQTRLSPVWVGSDLSYLRSSLPGLVGLYNRFQYQGHLDTHIEENRTRRTHAKTIFPIPARTGFQRFVGSDLRWQEFRPDEDVDIAALPDGGFNVGYIEAGEYMRYTINCTKKSEIRN